MITVEPQTHHEPSIAPDPPETAPEPVSPRFVWAKWSGLAIILLIALAIFAALTGLTRDQKANYLADLEARLAAGERLPSGEMRDYCLLKLEIEGDFPTECVGFFDDTNWKKPPQSPDELSEEWEEVTHPVAKERGARRLFRHRVYGVVIGFDAAKPEADVGKDAHRKFDHWHRYNPNSTGDNDLYLDQDGHPVAKWNDDSHIRVKK